MRMRVSASYLCVQVRAMSDSERLTALCQEFCSGVTSQNVPKILAKDIQDGVTDLLPIVEALGVYLTSTAVENRCQGTRLLSEVLTHLHSYQLPQDDTHYLTLFYCDRLKDRAVVIPHVLLGLHAMALHQKLCGEDVVSICTSIFKEVHNQSLPQVERRLVYNIMDYFLSEHLEAVKKMESGFVLGYIQAMDGEKDPRNLIIAFNSVHRIILHLPFDVLAEDLFEVTSCYFPIDFTPPPNDPHAITREQLVQGLRKCLTATAKFSEFCLPLMLEKLSSDLLSAKLDSLHTLAAGCECFGARGLSPYLQALWMAIRKEIFQSVSQDVEDAGIQCLTAMTRALSVPLQASFRGKGDLEEFLDMVLKECRHHLLEPELRMMQPAACMLEAVAMGSDPACTAVVTAIVPLLVEQFYSQSMVRAKKVILQVLLKFISVAKGFSHADAPNPLLPYKEALLTSVMAVLGGREYILVEVAVDVVCGFLSVEGFLDTTEVELLAEHLKQLALFCTDLTVRTRASVGLEHLALCHPGVVGDMMPSLLQLLHVGIPMETEREPSLERGSPQRVACLLASVSTDTSLQGVTLPALLSFLEQTVEQPFSEEHLALATAVSSSILTVVEKTVAQPGGTSLAHEAVGKRLLVMCIRPSVTVPLPERHVMMEEAVLRSCLSILRTFSQAATADQRIAESWITLIRSVFVEGNLTALNIPGASSFRPLEVSSLPQQTQLVNLLTATIGAMGKEVVCRHAKELLSQLLNQALHCPHAPTATQGAMCYASIINKLSRGGELDQLLDTDMGHLWRTISDGLVGGDTRSRGLVIWLWLAKALVMRSHPYGKNAAIKLFDLFGDQQLNVHSALGFAAILKDTEEVLNTKCHAIVRLMHKQQFFMEVVPDLIKRFHTAPMGERQYFLRALSHIMQGVPKQVLLEELPSLLPLLLESLEAEEVGLRESTLEGLSSLMQDTPHCVSNHVPSLIPRLLRLSTTPESMKIRSLALCCLGALSHLPKHLVYPYQNQVIRGLAPCLDDKKRLVRKEAVKSRASWFLLDAV